MRSISRQQRFRRKARVEIIPLIDVMFLLLCFFIYATMNMVVQQGVSIDLASSQTASPLPRLLDKMVLSVNAAGDYFVNETKVSQARLSYMLKEAKAEDNTHFIIEADKDAKHGQVIGLLDVVRREGVSRAVFAVENET